jgi:hypothetical protein
LDIFWISKSKNACRRYSLGKLGISNGNVLDSTVRSVVGFNAPKYVGAVRPKLAIAPKSICARNGCEINGEYWS